jgi:hypothetical protein
MDRQELQTRLLTTRFKTGKINPLFRVMVSHTKERDMEREPRKPSNWWALEREPWKRIAADIKAKEAAAAAAAEHDRALGIAFACVGASLRSFGAPAGPVTLGDSE